MKDKLKIFLFIFATIIFISVMLVFGYRYEKQNDINKNKEPAQTIQIINAQQEEKYKKPDVVSLGEFKITAYCSCYSCCSQWALNRPVDKNGNEIVYGSVGEKLIAGKSIAIDPNVIPYGSEIIINGNTYIAQDTGGAIKGNRIDVYCDNHQEALEFGVKYAEVFLINDNNY